jgi:SAM-dependent methyltransferase
MSTTTAPLPREAADPATVADRLLEGAVATFEQISVHLGLTLGLYQALQQRGPATPPGLAAVTGVDGRYTREWLEQQAVAGFLDCANPTAEPDARVFALPQALAEVLLRPSSPAFLGALPQAALSVTRVLDELEHAYRTGEGIPFARYGNLLRDGLGTLNGANLDRSLAMWMSHLPDIDRRLRTSDHPVVLDIGCGTGRSSLALARAYPRATVRGIDLDADSIATAEAATATAGLADRVTFVVGDAAAIATGERYDLVTVFEALHDMGDPVGALTAARRVLAPGGALLLADERTADTFAPGGDMLERLLYGWSVLHCLPATRAEDHVTANGTVLRASTVDAWARAAGFDGAAELDIDDDGWRFYRLAGGVPTGARP